jgi:D-aminopeptidase
LLKEAVYNGLFQATTTSGMGRTNEALPIDRVLEILKKYNVIE